MRTETISFNPRHTDLLEEFNQQASVIEQYFNQKIQDKEITKEELLSQIKSFEVAGHLTQRFRKCGKRFCKCARGRLHGPYWYHYQFIDGRLKTQYLCPVSRTNAKLKEIQVGINNRKYNRRLLRLIKKLEQEICLLEQQMQQEIAIKKKILKERLEIENRRILKFI